MCLSGDLKGFVPQTVRNALPFASESIRRNPSLGNQQPDEGQGRAENGKSGQTFIQDDGRRQYGDYGHQIDIDAGPYGAKDTDRPVPGNKAQGRSTKTKVEQIEQIGDICQPVRLPGKAEERKRGKHEEKTVEKDASCAEDGIKFQLSNPSHENGVDSPDQCCECCQQISQRVELESRSIEGNQNDSEEGNKQTGKEAWLQMFALQKQAGKYGRKEGGKTDDDPHIGGKGIGERDIFEQKVECHATQPRAHEQDFFFCLANPKKAGPKKEQRCVAHEKTEEENFQWSKVLQKNFGRDKGCPPNQNGHQSRHMAEQRTRNHESSPYAFPDVASGLDRLQP